MPLRTAQLKEFGPDNVRWTADNRLITAGMLDNEPACGGAPKTEAGIRCPRGYVVVTIDPKTIGDSGEADVNPNPLVWCHDFGGGRVFYSALGHSDESWSEPYMINLMKGALAYAVGK